MAYCTIADVKKVLTTDFYTYGAEVDDQIAWAEGEIDSVLGGHYSLPFDDTGTYSEVPVQIIWAASHLAAAKLWDEKTPLEGQTTDTRADEWRDAAMARLEKVSSGDEALTYLDGTVIFPNLATTHPRFYPSGVKDKADNADNKPFFTRAQAGEW